MLAPNKKFQSPSLGVANVVYLLRNKVDSQIRLDTKARCPIKRGPRLYNLRNLCVEETICITETFLPVFSLGSSRCGLLILLMPFCQLAKLYQESSNTCYFTISLSG